MLFFAQCNEMWIPASGKVLLAESGIQEKFRIQVPLTKTRIQYLKSGIHTVESRIQDCLGFSYMGQFFLAFDAERKLMLNAIK